MSRLALIIAAILTATLGASASGRFAWGTDLGTSIDVSSHDMTTIDLDAYFGYSNPAISMAGIGTGIHMCAANSCRAIPVYGILRTGFTSRPTLLFLDLRVGLTVDNVTYGKNQTVPFINPSLGFNLASSASFQSYMRLGYVYNGMKSFGPESDYTYIPGGLHMINVSIGITF